MKSFLRIIFLFEFFAWTVANESKTNDGIHQSQQCGVWLAESTIPHAGLGMYAGKSFQKNSQVTPGDIIIPLIEGEHDDGAVCMSVFALQFL